MGDGYRPRHGVGGPVSGLSACPDEETLARFLERGPAALPSVASHLAACQHCRSIISLSATLEVDESVMPLRLSAMTARARALFVVDERQRLDVSISAAPGRIVLLHTNGEPVPAMPRAEALRGQETATEPGVVSLRKRLPQCVIAISLEPLPSGNVSLRLTARPTDGDGDALRCSVWREGRELRSAYFRGAHQQLKIVGHGSVRLVIDRQRTFLGEVTLCMHADAARSGRS